MPVATTTALLIGAGIAGGTSLAAGAMGSHAAGKAADQQAESADKSLALQREMYQQQRADTAPWRNAGGQAVTTLSGLMGLPSGPVGGQAAATGTGINTTPQTQQALARYARQADTNTLSGPGVPKAFPASSSYPDQPPRVPGAANQSGYVTMEAPTGERQQVPREQVEFFQSHGARTV